MSTHKICSKEACTKQVKARGLCGSHYEYERRSNRLVPSAPEAQASGASKPRPKRTRKGERKKSDSTIEMLRLVRELDIPVDVPEHCALRECDLPFWHDILASRAPETWTSWDLGVAVTLARDRADLERLQLEMQDEDEIILNTRGDKTINPKAKLIAQMTTKVLNASRALHVHTTATQGRAVDVGRRLGAVEAARQVVTKTTTQGAANPDGPADDFDIDNLDAKPTAWVQ